MLPLKHPRRLAAGNGETMVPSAQVRQFSVHHHLQDHNAGTKVLSHNHFYLPAPEASADDTLDMVFLGS